ncbi:type IV secretion system DotC family protein [Tahibacter amnicola]|uniref:Type IV secretion system DotC family protein n=1 Tax=Tahibacter amnicola TaxID=2976241 RepID=A0ABY6BEV7_9GAMM|nr:type IV secretion system DotC family protein [Tahibacter amnicola]UXI68340.1 type IV secretion system DotC family protein [Tahibacter amnicola]
MPVDTALMTLADVERLYERPGYVEMMAEYNEAQQARQRAIRDTALAAGLKAGLIWQLGNVERSVARRERDFDTIYDFGYLLLHSRVVPPVVTEARDLYHQEGELTLRLSGINYTIHRQARFASAAPTWREYLSFPKPGKPTPSSGVRPRTKSEKAAWQAGARAGWEQGVEQANVMLQYALDRLNRDFTGMLRFHHLVAEGRVTMPIIASDDIALTGDARNLVLDETILRITVPSAFVSDMTQWQTWIRPTVGSATEAAAPGPSGGVRD